MRLQSFLQRRLPVLLTVMAGAFIMVTFFIAALLLPNNTNEAPIPRDLSIGNGHLPGRHKYEFYDRRGEPIQRIYYVNLDKNQDRRMFMEEWLSRRRDQSVPYYRIDASVGKEDICVAKKNNSTRCKGISGLSMTMLDIIDNHNTTGLTLVVEDDYEILDFETLLESLHQVPNDWDIVRWGCSGPIRRPPTMENVSDGVFRTLHVQPCDKEKNETEFRRCHFCGQTFAHLWRGDASAQRLREIWSVAPYDDIDCRLTTSKVKSYCVMGHKIGKKNMMLMKQSDITWEKSDRTNDGKVGNSLSMGAAFQENEREKRKRTRKNGERGGHLETNERIKRNKIRRKRERGGHLKRNERETREKRNRSGNRNRNRNSKNRRANS